MNLLVNFSRIDYKSTEISSLTHLPLNSILDFTHNFTLENQINDIINLDKDQLLKRAAREKYVDTIAKLSILKNRNKSIRDFKLQHFPIYWLLPISEKTSYYSCNFYLYYYNELLQSNPLFFKKFETLCFLFDKHETHFYTKIKELHKSVGILNCQLINNKELKSDKPVSHRYLFSYYRQLLPKYYQLLLLKGNAAINSTKNKKIIVTYFPQTWRSNISGDYLLKPIEKGAKSKSLYLPVFTDLERIKEWVDSGRDCNHILSNLPNKRQVFFLFFKSYFTFFKLNNFLNKVKTDSFFFDSQEIKREVQALFVNNTDLLFNVLWLDKICKNISESDLFYQDEVFVTGRLFSFFTKKHNRNNKSYGVMHGIYFPDHTSYQITDTELNPLTKSDDGFPLPDRYLVWGNYFKKLFLSNNHLNPNRLGVAGNLNYIEQVSGVENAKNTIGTDLKILWCTGWWKDFKLEFDLIHPLLEKIKVITVRKHPAADFTFNDLFRKLSIFSHLEIIESKEPTINESLAQHDLIITQSHSSVFLDALVAKKLVIRLFNYPYDEIDVPDSKQLRTVRNTFEALNAYDYLSKDGVAELDKYEHLAHLKPDVWNVLLN